MSSVNKITILGRLGHNPEVRSTQGGKTVTTLNVATSEKFKDAAGNAQEETTWHKIILWGQLGDLAGNYLKKGSQVYVEGKMKHPKFTGKDGVERIGNEIIASSLVFIGNKSDATVETSYEQKHNDLNDETQKFGPGMNTGEDSDVPF